MTNKEIANAFDELANLMELHEEDDFRIKTYRNAYLNLRKLDQSLAELSKTELLGLKGVGKATADKITQLVEKGKMDTLEKFRQSTPPGVVEMVGIKGFGPKKIRVIWKELGVETIGELLYACNENRLIELSGFGKKTQEDLREKLEFHLRSRDLYRLDTAEEAAEFVVALISARAPEAAVQIVGDLRRACPIIRRIEILVAGAQQTDAVFDEVDLVAEKTEANTVQARLATGTQVFVHFCEKSEAGSKIFRFTGPENFIVEYAKTFADLDFRGIATEAAVFEKAKIPSIPPELRDLPDIVAAACEHALPKLIEPADIQGVLHVHTTFSDGIHTLRAMCEAARNQGYAYIGITDHSQSAFYANGLKPERVLQQMDEIDQLNAEMAPFRILKGIESDITNDGSLDYSDDILEKFDFVMASVHSNLRMNEEKATERLLKAIENPFTTILGHPTGRILLARQGYPLNWRLILDACAKHGVTIELNANPHRLDMDYTLIPEALKRGIKIAINPDAHSVEGIKHLHYGVLVARKGGLTANSCLNSLDPAVWLRKK